jgi:hypothetical protein
MEINEAFELKQQNEGAEQCWTYDQNWIAKFGEPNCQWIGLRENL